MNPWNMTLPYVYSSFDYPHCVEQDIDIGMKHSLLLESKKKFLMSLGGSYPSYEEASVFVNGIYALRIAAKGGKEDKATAKSSSSAASTSSSSSTKKEGGGSSGKGGDGKKKESKGEGKKTSSSSSSTRRR